MEKGGQSVSIGSLLEMLHLLSGHFHLSVRPKLFCSLLPVILLFKLTWSNINVITNGVSYYSIKASNTIRTFFLTQDLYPLENASLSNAESHGSTWVLKWHLCWGFVCFLSVSQYTNLFR